MSKDHKKLFYRYELSLWQLLITFRKICFSNPFHTIVPLSFNSIQDSTKIAAKYKKVLILWGTLLQNEFTIDKYQKEIDSKCFSLKNYVNNAIVKYCMIPNEMYVVGYILRLNLLLVARYFLFVAPYFLLRYS